MRWCLATSLILCVLTFNASGAVKNWTGLYSENWFEGGNWDPTGTPGPTDDVFISGSVKIMPDANPAHCYTLTIESGGGVTICYEQQLIVHGATVDLYGPIIFATCDSGEPAQQCPEFTGGIHFKDDAVITGYSGLPVIEGHYCVLSPGVGWWLRGAISADEDKTVTLTGVGRILGSISILPIFVNDGDARVGPTLTLDTLELNDGAKSGSGTWFVTDGKLEVNAVTSGSGRWELYEGTLSELLFTVSPQDLSGDFLIEGGTLDVGAALCTTGNVEFTGGKIKTGVSGSVAFSGSCGQ